MCIFFFNDTATTEIYTLSLHDALPISLILLSTAAAAQPATPPTGTKATNPDPGRVVCRRQADLRSEEHTSELQSQSNLVCRLLLEKKKKTTKHRHTSSKHTPTLLDTSK